MLREGSQRKSNTVRHHLYVEFLKKTNSEKQSRAVVTRSWGIEGKWGDISQRIQSSSCKIDKFGDLTYNLVIIANTVLRIAKRTDLKYPHCKKEMITM